MATLNKQEVEKNISHLLNIVALGDEIIITKKGKIFAKIIPPKAYDVIANSDQVVFSVL